MHKSTQSDRLRGYGQWIAGVKFMAVRVLSMAAVAIWLAACVNPLASFAPNAADTREAVWYDAEAPLQTAPRYCYRTLARVDCHSAPLTGQESRLVASTHGATAE